METKTIFMVEDDEMISEIYRKQFEKAGYNIEIINNGEVALEKIKKDEPDLVLLDLLMPEMGGIDILRELEGWQGKTKKIVFSNDQDKDRENEAFSLGADGFWIKANYTPAQLLEEIKRTL